MMKRVMSSGKQQVRSTGNGLYRFLRGHKREAPFLLSVCFLIGPLFVAGCASTVSQQSNVVPEPGSEKALVCFIREWKFFGGGVAYRIKERGEVIAVLPNASYVYLLATPGRHIYTGEEDAKSDPVVTLEAGRAYFFKCYPIAINSGSRLVIETTDEAYAKERLSRLRCVTGRR